MESAKATVLEADCKAKVQVRAKKALDAAPIRTHAEASLLILVLADQAQARAAIPRFRACRSKAEQRLSTCPASEALEAMRLLPVQDTHQPTITNAPELR